MKHDSGKSLMALFLLWCFLLMNPAIAQDSRTGAQGETSPREPADEFTQTFNQARIFLVNGKIDEAIESYRKAAAIKKGQCADCFQMIGQIYFQLSRYEDAAAAFRQAVALKPANEAALSNYLGVALFLQDDKKALPEAIAAFQQAIQLSGDKIPKAHYNRGHALVKAGRTAEGVTALKRYLELEPDAGNADEVKAIIANPKMAGAKFATDFKVKNVKGEEISLKALRGKIVLLDFWATWCGPCRVEMPAVKRIAKKYAGDQFVIVGISLDRDRRSFDEYVKQESMTWQQFFDGKGWGNEVARLYGIHRIPATVLIDQDGVIRATDLRGEQLSNKIGALIKQLREKQNNAQR